MANSIFDTDKEKIKTFFSMLGDLVAMFIGLFSIFKKNEKSENKN